MAITAGDEHAADPSAGPTGQVLVLFGELGDGRVDPGLPALVEHVLLEFLFHEMLEGIGLLLRRHERDRRHPTDALEEFSAINLHRVPPLQSLDDGSNSHSLQTRCSNVIVVCASIDWESMFCSPGPC